MQLFNWRKDTQPNVVNRKGDLFSWMGFGSSSSNVPLNNSTALESATVLCAVKTIAESLASMPITVMETVEVDGRERTRKVKGHWANRLLSKQPNSWQSPYEFIEGMAINAVLGAGALAIKVVVGNEVRELLPVPAGSWTQEQLDNYRVQYNVRYSNGQSQIFSQEQVVFIRGISLDGYSGLRAIESARSAIGIANSLEKQQTKLSDSGGKPSGVLSFENTLKPETSAAIRETWNKQFGPNGEGGIAILDGSTKFHTLSVSNTDAQFIENRKFQIEEIARAFRVPVQMLMAQGQYASSDDLYRFFVKTTLLPWINRFESAFNRDLLGNHDTQFIDMDEKSLLRGDLNSQSQWWGRALGSGGISSTMTVNEVRAECGLDAFDADWADELTKGAYQLSAMARAGNLNETEDK